MITFKDFTKLEIKIGTIKSAEKIESSERLILFKVNVGEEERQIISGVAEHYPEPEDLVGKQVPVLMNLEPREIMGQVSQGMILYVIDGENLTTLEPEATVNSGADVR